MFINNVNSYNYVLNLYFFKKVYILNDSSNSKYSWSESFFNEDIFYSFLYVDNSLVNKLPEINLSTNLNLYQKINFKKKTSLLKKNFDIDYTILNKVFHYKDNFNKNKFYTVEDENSKEFYSSLSFKSLDFKKKLKYFIKINRKIVKNFYNIKHYRNFSFSKHIKKICNVNKNDFLINLENSLINILLKSDFFFCKKDCIWFIKNGLISLNANVTCNPNAILKINDIVNVSNSMFYFNFYKFKLDHILNNIYRINLKLWSINNNRFKNTENKIKNSVGFKENYPSWIENYKYFKKDVPKNLEVDYISMSIVVLNYSLNYNNLDYYNFKFISLYMNRSYNWKYII